MAATPLITLATLVRFLLPETRLTAGLAAGAGEP
jgi:hypothetical protein